MPAEFYKAAFQGHAYFSRAIFQDADFWEVIFQDADFSETTFQGYAGFSGATFQDSADFWGASFRGRADFSETIFQSARFLEVVFQDFTDFSETVFQSAYFRRATFGKKVELTPKSIEKVDLGYTEFLSRSYITVDLKRTLFHRAFIGNVAFVDCTWPDDFVIYEEKHMKEEDMTFKELETIYRGLKQNLQNHGDYTTAGKFYYREMEMRRKGASKKGRLWLEIYRFLAGYGEKPRLVIRNSFLVIFLAACLFFFCGVARVGTELPAEENPDVINYSLYSVTLNIEALKDFGYCMYYSVVTFTTLGYGDIHPMGYSYVVASAEALCGAFLMALFVVAFSRKMMR